MWWDAISWPIISEMLPTDTPEPLGKHVVTISYYDTNLYHNILTDRSIAGVLHLVNKTAIYWYSKKQASVETATYGSEFSSARTCVEQIIDLRNTLWYLRVPIRKKSFVFGDNNTVVNGSVVLHAKINKRHVALSFHIVREAIVAKIVSHHFIKGSANPADTLNKHWGHSKVWPVLKAILF